MQMVGNRILILIGSFGENWKIMERIGNSASIVSVAQKLLAFK